MATTTKKPYKFYPKKYPTKYPPKAKSDGAQEKPQEGSKKGSKKEAPTTTTTTTTTTTPYTKKGYTRPAETFTDKLTDKEIMNLLEDYEKVTDISKVDNGVSLRYFVKDATDENAKPKFRMGGILINKEGLPDYIMLTSGGAGAATWSVQMKTAILYKKIPDKNIKAEYEKVLAEKNEIIDKLVAQIKQLTEENERYKNERDEKPVKKSVRKKA